MQTLYRFRGGRHDGVVAVADREPVGQVDVRGRRLVDGRGVVVGRVFADWEKLPSAIAGQLQDHQPAPAPAPEPAPPALTFPDEKAWRAHVKAWALENTQISIGKRGRLPNAAVEAWQAVHGQPVYA